MEMKNDTTETTMKTTKSQNRKIADLEPGHGFDLEAHGRRFYTTAERTWDGTELVFKYWTPRDSGEVERHSRAAWLAKTADTKEERARHLEAKAALETLKEQRRLELIPTAERITAEVNFKSRAQAKATTAFLAAALGSTWHTRRFNIDNFEAKALESGTVKIYLITVASSGPALDTTQHEFSVTTKGAIVTFYRDASGETMRVAGFKRALKRCRQTL